MISNWLSIVIVEHCSMSIVGGEGCFSDDYSAERVVVRASEWIAMLPDNQIDRHSLVQIHVPRSQALDRLGWPIAGCVFGGGACMEDLRPVHRK